MYGKIFRSMYDGSLCENWQALVTFQQMIILSDSEGVVDMTPEAISRTTNIPIEIIQEGILELEKPDPSSRTPDEKGKRLVRLDRHRTWGWKLVNHNYYKKLASYEDKKQADRERIAAKRKAEKDNENTVVADSSSESQTVADVAHTNKDKDTDTEEKESTLTGTSRQSPCRHEEIINSYHEILPELPQIIEWDNTAKNWLKARWRSGKEKQSLSFWKDFFNYVKTSPFLLGDNERGWTADLRWLVKAANFAKVVNGSYHYDKIAKNQLALEVWREYHRKKEEEEGI